MKICIIPPILSGTVAGGINTQISKTVEYLKKAGHKVTLFNQWKKYDWKEFDIVHMFRADATNLAMAEWLSDNNIKFAVSPVFYSSHSSSKIKTAIKYTELAKKMVSGITSDLLIKKEICQLSSLVLPNTEDEAKLISSSMSIKRDKVIAVPNGIDTSFTKANPDLFINKYGIKDFILSTGHFGFKRKNLEKLLKAVIQIDHPTVLIGSLFDDSYSKNCKDIIESSKNITWIDTLNHDDPMLASAYSAASVFALPSLYETPGLSALEAGLCGCNIAITPIGGTKEYFKEYAQYPDPFSVESIRDCVKNLLAKEKDNALSKYIKKNYSWKSVAEKTVEAYQRLR